MTQNEHLMLHLLRAALWEKKPDATLFGPNTDWQGIMQVAFKQAVQGLVAQAVRMLAEDMDESEQTEQLIAMAMRTEMTVARDNQQVDDALAEIVAALREHGIDSVLVKGQAIGRCYAVPELRVCGDIDLYVGQEGCRQAIDVLRPRYGNSYHKKDHPKHFNLTVQGVEIELHRYLVNLSDHVGQTRLGEWFDKEIQDGHMILIRGNEVKVASPQFDILYVFYHLWTHFFADGIGIRQLCDWARCLYTYRRELDADMMEQLLRDSGLLHDWQVFGRFIVDYLGMPSELFPLYVHRHRRAARALATALLDYGNFGKEGTYRFESNLSRVYLKHKWQTFCFYAHHWNRLMRVSPGTTWPRMRNFYVTGLDSLLHLE